MLHELPLVLFTLAAQLSVGSFLTLGAIHVFGWAVPAARMDKVTDPALYAIGPLLVLGLAASTAHLGSPLRAPNALLHLGGSPLSLEIFLGMGFLGSGAVFAFVQWRKWLPAKVRHALAVVTALLGACLVWTISQVYSLRTIPAWATWFTPVNFFITSFLLGSLAVVAALIVSAKFVGGNREDRDFRDSIIQAISLAAVVLIVVKLALQPAYLGYLANHSARAAQVSLRTLTDTYGHWLHIANAALLIGVAMLGFLLYRSSVIRRYINKGKAVATANLSALAVAAFVIVAVAELVHRMLFYALIARVGFGGQ